MTFLWGRFLVMSTLIIGGGYTLLAKEEFYNKLSPELKRKVDEIRAQRAPQTAVKDALQTAGEEGKIVWGDDLKKIKK